MLENLKQIFLRIREVKDPAPFFWENLSVVLAGFWICCSSHHSEQMSLWAELYLMSNFRVTSPKRSRFNMKNISFSTRYM